MTFTNAEIDSKCNRCYFARCDLCGKRIRLVYCNQFIQLLITSEKMVQKSVRNVKKFVTATTLMARLARVDTVGFACTAKHKEDW